jgi:hypothetical protein
MKKIIINIRRSTFDGWIGVDRGLGEDEPAQYRIEEAHPMYKDEADLVISDWVKFGWVARGVEI